MNKRIKYVIGIQVVKTSSYIVFFENGLGFYTLPDENEEKQELYVTYDSGKTFTKVELPDGEFTLSNPNGKQ